MIYVLAGTQVATVIGAVVGLWFLLGYFQERDQLEQRTFDHNISVFERIKKESDEAIWALLNQFQQERELLIERIQHPVMTQGQAASTGREPSVSVVDEETEEKAEYPEEGSPGVVEPVQPVKPFGGSSNGSTE